MSVERAEPREATVLASRSPAPVEEPRVFPGRHGLSREEVADSQRRRLMRATVEVIGRKGFADTVVADLLAHAGVARKTFYELFSGKEECVLAAYDEAAAELRALVLSAYEQGVTAQERIDFVVDRVFQWVARDPDRARVCLLEAPASGSTGRKRVTATNTWLTGVAADWLGDVDVPELLPELLVGGVHQMMIHRLTIDTATLPPLATELTEVWLDVERWPSAPRRS